MAKSRMRSLLRTASKVAELPLSNRDRKVAKLNWYKTKWGRKDDWERR